MANSCVRAHANTIVINGLIVPGCIATAAQVQKVINAKLVTVNLRTLPPWPGYISQRPCQKGRRDTLVRNITYGLLSLFSLESECGGGPSQSAWPEDALVKRQIGSRLLAYLR